MNTCKTCKHWITPDEDWDEKQVADYRDPKTLEPITPPFEVRICKHPAKRFCQRPVEKDGFAVSDGMSNYFACLATAEEFGCVRHEAL